MTLKDTILEVDVMRFGLHGQIRRVWAQRGVKIVQPRQFEFDYRYFILGVNPRTGTIQWDWMETMKADDFVVCLQDWQADGLIWDGARSHYAQSVTQLDFEFIYQPPASPELNPVERLFQELRREIEGLIYENLDQKQQAFEQVLCHWQQHPEIIRSIAGWRWICEAMDNLPDAA
ncbi:MAG: transposase [Aggregatilineales bacterium]